MKERYNLRERYDEGKTCTNKERKKKKKKKSDRARED